MGPKDWLPGMTVTNGVEGQVLLLKRHSGSWELRGVVGYYAGAYRNWKDGTFSSMRWHPATYADLGREPREGDLAVRVPWSDGDDPLGCVGDVYLMREGQFIDQTYPRIGQWAGDEDELRNFAPLDRAIYEASREPEKREPKAGDCLCTECGAMWSSSESMLCPHGPHDEPSPRECLRVEAARRDAEYEAHSLRVGCEVIMGSADPLAALSRMRLHMALLTRAVRKMTPCGDCPVCLDDAADREWMAERDRVFPSTAPVGDGLAIQRAEDELEAARRRTHENLRALFGGGR